MRTLISIFLAALLAASSVASVAAPRARDEERLTPEEEREARELASSFLRRFAATRDFAPLLDEFFAADLSERLRGETHDEDSFPFSKLVAPDTFRQAEASELRRFYAATESLYLLSEVHGRVAKFTLNEKRAEDEDEREPGVRDYFTPDALAAARRDPLLARLITEADDADKPSDLEEGEDADEDDEELVAEGGQRFRELTTTLEEVAGKLRANLKSLPAWAVARLLGDDSDAGAFEEEMGIGVTRLTAPFRGEPEGARLICVTARMFHVDLVRVEGRLRVLNVSAESYELQTEEQKLGVETLANFLRAIETGDAEAFWALLGRGVNVSAKESDGGMTPLHYAALYKRPDMLRVLINYGANVNARNRHGNTVLFYATGSPELTLALLNAGADVNAENGNGITALKLASRYSSREAREVVRILKNFGARE